MYTSDRDVFKRSAEARRSKKRQDLRKLTEMSDEQLEGWAIMFDRNVRLMPFDVCYRVISFLK